MIIVDDDDTCPKCGAYWTNTGHCVNGHPREKRNDPIWTINVELTNPDLSFSGFTFFFTDEERTLETITKLESILKQAQGG